MQIKKQQEEQAIAEANQRQRMQEAAKRKALEEAKLRQEALIASKQKAIEEAKLKAIKEQQKAVEEEKKRKNIEAEAIAKIKRQQEKLRLEEEAQRKREKQNSSSSWKNFDPNEYVKNSKRKSKDKIPSIEKAKDEFQLYMDVYNIDEIANPSNSMYNFWFNFKNKYKISNLWYWLNNIDYKTQMKLWKKRNKYENFIKSKHERNSTYDLDIKTNTNDEDGLPQSDN